MSEHEVWNELGNLYLISGAYREAAEAYQRSIELDGGLGTTYSNLAQAFVKQGEYEKALELYQKSIALSADDMEKAMMWNQLGNVYVQLKDYDEALLAYQIADELEEKHNPASDEVLPEISSLVSSDDLETSSQEVDIVSEMPDLEGSFPQDAVTVSGVTDNGSGYQPDLSATTDLDSTETWTEAGTDWEMELDGALDQDAEVYFPQPDENSLAGWLPIPEVELTDNVREDPDLQEPEYRHLEFADAEPAPGNRKYEYNEQFSLQVELNTPEKPAPTLGFSKKKDEQKTAAQIEYERSQANEPAFESREEELNEIMIEISKFKRVVQINPRNAVAWDTLGTHYKSAGMYKDAILAYQQAISADPAKGYYHHHLALVFAAEGRNEDAIMAYQKVIEIDPDHNLANAALGGYYRKMGLEELAQKHIGKAMKNIYNSESEYNQACLEAICGNSDQAIELLRIALEEKQTYVNWVMHDPDLDAIREHPSFKQLISDFIK
jgi:pentatricopeptide repeat protein